MPHIIRLCTGHALAAGKARMIQEMNHHWCESSALRTLKQLGGGHLRSTTSTNDHTLFGEIRKLKQNFECS